MRKLITSDVFKMARIIREAKVKESLLSIFKTKTNAKNVDEKQEQEGADNKKTQEEAGFEAVMTVFEACSTEKLEAMMYEFLGGVCEKSPEDIAKQSLEITMEEISRIVKENNISVFFEKAGQLMK